MGSPAGDSAKAVRDAEAINGVFRIFIGLTVIFATIAVLTFVFGPRSISIGASAVVAVSALTAACFRKCRNQRMKDAAAYTPLDASKRVQP